MNPGRTLFAQLVELLPRRAWENALERYPTRRPVRTLSSLDQLLCMIFAQVTGRTSLRETVTCLRALGPRRYHCGIRARPSRSTLAEANEGRDSRIFRDTALAMIGAARLELPVDADLLRLQAQAYAMDSTTIDLCLKLFPWAHFRRHKAGIKAHTLLDLNTGIPMFMRISPAKTHDVWMLDWITFQAGAFYVLDKGYVDFQRLYTLHQAGAFFVTRAKRNLDFGIRQRLKVKPRTGVSSDRLICLRGPKTRRLYPDTLRLVRYVDPQTGRRLQFLTNHHTLDAASVALLYRKRWRIELFFKWVKQHLHIKAFFGTTANAVETQVWIAVMVYVLVVKFKHRYQLPQDLNEILQILSVMSLEKTPVFELFSQNQTHFIQVTDRNQLSLFEM